MNFVDSHAHLSSPSVISHIEGILVRAREAHISHILNICTDPLSLEEGIRLSARFPFIKNAGATTPHDVAQEGESAFPVFSAAAKQGLLAAVGETGLDYHYQHSPKEEQIKFFKRYLFLAAETHLPVIFHCREAFPDLFAISDIEYPKNAPAVLHCFTGTVSEAEEVLKRGWHLSLSGIVTFKKSGHLREVAKLVPLSQLLIETDTPYLAPQGHRGRPNEPSFLPETAVCIAEAKGISLDEIAKAASENAVRLFGFK
jgi:TatD DNase family protein